MNQAINTKIGFPHFRVLEEAHEAVTTLRALKPFLSPEDEETLIILMDKELMSNLETSLNESDAGKIEPIESIL